MRTKTLLLAGAISALSLASSMAQVYSVNVVGYVNVPIVSGFNCIANPLDASPDNTLTSVVKDVKDGSTILKWTGTSFTDAQLYVAALNGWYVYDAGIDDFVPSTMTIETGEGFFFSSTVATNITFVGDVRQGTVSNYLHTGFNLVSGPTPQSGNLLSFGFPATDGDTVLFWKANSNPQAYSDAILYSGGLSSFVVYDAGIDDFVPVTVDISVAQGFFVNKRTAAPWSVTFNVN